jgi:CubicO group peptidase (beta-lactamase class C family)
VSHRGVQDTAAPLADRVPMLEALVGSVLSCNGQRGRFQYSNEGYAALGLLLSDVTGSPYADAVRAWYCNRCR